MKSGSSTLVYYEDTHKKGIFVSGRSYEIIHQLSEIEKKGFVVMNHIPVMEEEMSIFEDRTKRKLRALAKHTGLKAVRLLREKKSTKYIVLSQWETEKDYNLWQKNSEENDLNFSNMARLPAYFADRPFTNTYYMIKEDESEQK